MGLPKWGKEKLTTRQGSNQSRRGLDPARRANVGDRTHVAFRRPGVAHTPAVKDENVRNVRPFVAREKWHQIALDFHRVLLGRETEPDREAADVGVYHPT